MRTMNVLVIESSVKWAENLTLVGCNTYYIDYRKKLGGRYNVDSSKVNFIPLDCDRSSSFYKRYKAFSKVVSKYNITHVLTARKDDVVMAFICKMLRHRKLICISTNHNSYAWVNSKQVWIYSKLLKYTTDAYFSLAMFVTKQLVKNGYSGNKILQVANTVSGIEPKTSWEIKDNAPNIIYVSQVYSGKRQLVLLEAINRVKSRYPSIHATIYGNVIEEEYNDLLKQYIIKNNLQKNITLYGVIDNIELLRLLPTYDIYISPSIMEMNPNNLLEAGAAKIPVIAVRTSGVVDVIEDGVTGLLFEKDDVAACAEGLVRLIEDSDLRKTLGENLYNVVSVKNSPEYQGNLMWNFMKKL